MKPEKETPFERLADLNKLIHEPARMAILTALSACKRADFLFLMRLTGLTKGNLSSHLSKLEEASLLKVGKEFEGKKPVTLLELTDSGRKAIETHWKALNEVRQSARKWGSSRKEKS